MICRGMVSETAYVFCVRVYLNNTCIASLRREKVAKFKTTRCSCQQLPAFTLTVLQLWLDRGGSHLIGVGGGLLVVALAVASVLTVASLLAVLGLVASLGAGVGVLLAEGIGGGLLFL